MARKWMTWLAIAAVVMIGAGPAPTSPAAAAAAAPSCQETLPQLPTQPAFSVPPYSTSYKSVAVATTGQVADIDVRLWADGIAAGDFSFGPDDDFPAHTVLLDSVGGTVDLVGATYDDEASGPLSGSSPYSGRYQPQTPLSALDGLQTARSWRLQAVNWSDSTFQVDAWTITITYAGCVPDQDSDGVADARDSCRNLAARTASGCPVAARSLTVKYRHRAFKGRLSSSTTACRAGRPVTIWKVRGGPDRRIGTRSTRADGSYKIVRARKKGKYYATSPRAVVPNIAECPAVRSRKIRIR